jgi:hypothetical protein
VIFELVIVLENSQKALRSLNNIVKDSLPSNNAEQPETTCQSYDVEDKASRH